MWCVSLKLFWILNFVIKLVKWIWRYIIFKPMYKLRDNLFVHLNLKLIVILYFRLVVGLAHLKNWKSWLTLPTQWGCLYSWMLSIPMPQRMWWMASMNLMALTRATSMEVPGECILCGIPGSSTTQGTGFLSLHTLTAPFIFIISTVKTDQKAGKLGRMNMNGRVMQCSSLLNLVIGHLRLQWASGDYLLTFIF